MALVPEINGYQTLTNKVSYCCRPLCLASLSQSTATAPEMTAPSPAASSVASLMPVFLAGGLLAVGRNCIDTAKASSNTKPLLMPCGACGHKAHLDDIAQGTASTVLGYDESFVYFPNDATFGYCSTYCSSADNCSGNEGCQVSSATRDPALVLVPFGTGNNRDAAARFMKIEPVQLWDSRSGLEASLTSFFVMRLSKVAGFATGDGMTFLMSSDRETPAGSQGGNLGLFQSDNAGIPLDDSLRIVTLKFDTHNNSKYRDPPAPYVGLDINSLVSSIHTGLDNDSLGASFLGNKFGVWLEYNASLHSVEVSMILWPDGGGFDSAKELRSNAISMFQYDLTLSACVTEFSYVGFSAGTGRDFEINELFYWEFESTGLGPRPKSALSAAVKLALLILAGLLLAMLLLCLCFCCLWRRRRRKRKDRSPVLPSVAVKVVMGGTAVHPGNRDRRKGKLPNSALAAADKEKRERLQGEAANKSVAQKRPVDTALRPSNKQPGGRLGGRASSATNKKLAAPGPGETELSGINNKETPKAHMGDDALRETKMQTGGAADRGDTSPLPTSKKPGSHRPPGPGTGTDHASPSDAGDKAPRVGRVEKPGAQVARARKDGVAPGASGEAETSATRKEKASYWSNFGKPGARKSPQTMEEESMRETKGNKAAVATGKETGRHNLSRHRREDFKHAERPLLEDSLHRPGPTSGAASRPAEVDATRRAAGEVSKPPSTHVERKLASARSTSPATSPGHASLSSSRAWTTTAQAVPTSGAAVSKPPSTHGEPKLDSAPAPARGSSRAALKAPTSSPSETTPRSSPSSTQSEARTPSALSPAHLDGTTSPHGAGKTHAIPIPPLPHSSAHRVYQTLPSPRHSEARTPSPHEAERSRPTPQRPVNKERVKSISRDKQGLRTLMKHKSRKTFLEKTRKTLLRLLGLPTKIKAKKPLRKHHWIPPGPAQNLIN